jgi:hypothetical protein
MHGNKSLMGLKSTKEEFAFTNVIHLWYFRYGRSEQKTPNLSPLNLKAPETFQPHWHLK